MAGSKTSLVHLSLIGNGRSPQLVRFGLMWKIYDMVAVKGINIRAPILDLGRWYRPPKSLGLTQPKARRGIVLPSVLIFFGKDYDH